MGSPGRGDISPAEAGTRLSDLKAELTYLLTYTPVWDHYVNNQTDNHSNTQFLQAQRKSTEGDIK